jgi:hypothetical protein
MNDVRRRVVGIIGSLGVATGCQVTEVSNSREPPERDLAPVTLIIGLDPTGALAGLSEPAEYSRALSREFGAPLNVVRIASGRDLIVSIDVDAALRESLGLASEVSIHATGGSPGAARVAVQVTGPECARVAETINAKRKASPLFNASLGDASTGTCPGALSVPLDMSAFKSALIRRIKGHPSIRYVEEDATVETQKPPPK